MDAKTRAILVIKYKPMIEGFKNAIAEERKKGASDARLAAILQYVETTSSGIDPDAGSGGSSGSHRCHRLSFRACVDTQLTRIKLEEGSVAAGSLRDITKTPSPRSPLTIPKRR